MQTSESFLSKLTRSILYIVLLAMAVGFVISLRTCHSATKATHHVRYVGMLNLASEKIAKTIHGMEMNAMNVFDEVEKHLDSPQTVIAALQSKTRLNPQVRGYFAAFEPDYFPEKGTWFEPYVVHVDTSDFELRMVGSARHNYHKSDWYVRAKKGKESFWSDPYYYYDESDISGHYTTFVKPVFDKSGRLACVCGADMTFEWLGKELEGIDEAVRNDTLLNEFMDSDDDFYTVVINDDGSCIAYPEGKKVTLTAVDLSQRKSGVIDMEVNGVPSTVYYGPLEHVDWSVAIVVSK